MEERFPGLPQAYALIAEATREAQFTMGSDVAAGALLKTLAGSKPGGSLLELGTGTGLSTAWILDGMDTAARLTSLDNDANVLRIAEQFLGDDTRLTLVHTDGGDWLEQNAEARFDFIFADSWHGKYLMLEQALHLLNPGGLYVIDDMLPQPNWPTGHHEKAIRLLEVLHERTDLSVTQLPWSTGVVIAVKRAEAN